MRSMYTGKFFFSMMKNKPHLREYYDNLENYTVDEINNFPINMWFRERLLELKTRGFNTKDPTLEDRLSLRSIKDFNETSIPDVTEYLVYKANKQFLYGIAIIEEGEYILKTNNGIYQGDSFIKSDKLINDKDIVFYRNMTIIEYKDFITEEMEKKYNDSILKG